MTHAGDDTEGMFGTIIADSQSKDDFEEVEEYPRFEIVYTGASIQLRDIAYAAFRLCLDHTVSTSVPPIPNPPPHNTVHGYTETLPFRNSQGILNAMEVIQQETSNQQIGAGQEICRIRLVNHYNYINLYTK